MKLHSPGDIGDTIILEIVFAEQEEQIAKFERENELTKNCFTGCMGMILAFTAGLFLTLFAWKVFTSHTCILPGEYDISFSWLSHLWTFTSLGLEAVMASQPSKVEKHRSFFRKISLLCALAVFVYWSIAFLFVIEEAKSQYSFLIFWPSLMILVMVVGERAFAQTEREIAELRGIPLQHKSA